MVRLFQRWFAALVLSGLLCLPALAQVPDADGPKERPSSVPQGVVAFLVTVLVLVVICLPSRRQ